MGAALAQREAAMDVNTALNAHRQAAAVAAAAAQAQPAEAATTTWDALGLLGIIRFYEGDDLHALDNNKTKVIKLSRGDPYNAKQYALRNYFGHEKMPKEWQIAEHARLLKKADAKDAAAGEKRSRDVPSKQEMIDTYAVAVAIGGEPFVKPEGVYTKYIVQTLCPGCPSVSANAIADRVRAMGKELILQQKQEFAARKAHGVVYHAVSDLWSDVSMRNFIGTGVVFIDYKASFFPRQKLLGCDYFPGLHTHRHVANKLVDQMNANGLPWGSLASFVTDSGENLTKAVDVLEKNHGLEVPVDPREDVAGTYVPQAGLELGSRCVNHLIDNAIGEVCRIKKFLDETETQLNQDYTSGVGWLGRSLAAVKRLLSKFSKSGKRREALAKEQQLLNMYPLYMPIYWVDTRWSSEYLMLKRLCDLWPAMSRLSGHKVGLSGAEAAAFNKALAEVRVLFDGGNIDGSDLPELQPSFLPRLVKLLSKAAEVTTFFSGQGYVTISHWPSKRKDLMEWCRCAWREQGCSDNVIVIIGLALRRAFSPRLVVTDMDRLAELIDPETYQLAKTNLATAADPKKSLDDMMNLFVAVWKLYVRQKKPVAAPLVAAAGGGGDIMAMLGAAFAGAGAAALPAELGNDTAEEAAFRKKLQILLLPTPSSNDPNAAPIPAVLEVASRGNIKCRAFYDDLLKKSSADKDLLLAEAIGTSAAVLGRPKASVFLEHTFSVAGQVITNRRSAMKPETAAAAILLRRSYIGKKAVELALQGVEQKTFKKRGIHAKRARLAAEAALPAAGGAPAVDIGMVQDPETGADLGDEFDDEIANGQIEVEDEEVRIINPKAVDADDASDVDDGTGAGGAADGFAGLGDDDDDM